MLTFYYCLTDENGVLCVNQLADDQDWTFEEVVRQLVDHYPDIVYFAVDNRVPELRVPVSRNALNPTVSNPTESEVTS